MKVLEETQTSYTVLDERGRLSFDVTCRTSDVHDPTETSGSSVRTDVLSFPLVEESGDSEVFGNR